MSEPIPVGRELDALVAERVMGWGDVNPREINGRMTGIPPGEMDWHAIPAYSTDPAAAALVRAQWREQGYDYELGWWAKGQSFQCCVWPPGHWICRRGASEEEATCRAALAAKERQAEDALQS